MQKAVTGSSDRRVEFDYLRAFVIVLVVWHHAILAYATFSFLNPENPVDTFSPVVDSQRWVGFDVIAGFNDIFFMALMFFISGLFVWHSLGRKGVRKFIGDRLVRLGIPFAIGVLVLMPLAYYPAQLTVEQIYGGATGYIEFWLDLAGAGFISGPLWFIWLLLVFDCLVALFYQLIAKSGRLFSDRVTSIFERPLAFFSLLLVATAVAYLPMVRAFGSSEWIGVGPFVAQASRILFYAVYFLAGTAIGAYGIDRSVLRTGGALAKRWWVWLILSVISYLVLLVSVVGGPMHPVVLSIVFVFCCLALVFSVMAFFLRFVTRRVRVFDSLAANAYGIYILHYAFVTWVQFWLLGVDLAAIPKALLAFVATLLLSWGTSAMLRRIPFVARVI